MSEIESLIELRAQKRTEWSEEFEKAKENVLYNASITEEEYDKVYEFLSSRKNYLVEDGYIGVDKNQKFKLEHLKFVAADLGLKVGKLDTRCLNDSTITGSKNDSLFVTTPGVYKKMKSVVNTSGFLVNAFCFPSAFLVVVLHIVLTVVFCNIANLVALCLTAVSLLLYILADNWAHQWTRKSYGDILKKWLSKNKKRI